MFSISLSFFLIWGYFLNFTFHLFGWNLYFNVFYISMSLFLSEWPSLLFSNILLFHGYISLSYWQILLFYSGLSYVPCSVSSSSVYFCLLRSLSSKEKASPESKFPPFWTTERTWRGLNADFEPIILFSFLSLTLASVEMLHLQFLGLSQFSGMNYLCLHGFPSCKHVGFWVLYGVKSIFTLLSDFLLQFLWMSLFAFIFSDFFSFSDIFPEGYKLSVFHLFIVLLSFLLEFQKGIKVNICVQSVMFNLKTIVFFKRHFLKIQDIY